MAGGSPERPAIHTERTDCQASSWYQISVATSAADLAGNTVAGPFTSKFQTAASTDTTAATLTITAPVATSWTNDATYTITGTTDGSVIRVYRDSTPFGSSVGAEDVLVATSHVAGQHDEFLDLGPA